MKAGDECPGFHQHLRWSRKHELYQTPEASSDIEPSSLPVASLAALTNVRLESTVLCPVATLEEASDNLDVAWWPFFDQGNELPGIAQPGQGIASPIHPPEIPRHLTHFSTSLVEYWFRCVCPMWSVFDSEINYNRQIAQNSWTVSEAAFLAIQAMSAACLVAVNADIRDELVALRSQATSVIHANTKAILESVSTPSRVTCDLVFAIFALGTSLNWNTAIQAENTWARTAHDLLYTWQRDLSGTEGLIHAYFCQALTYWEMLLTLVHHSVIPKTLRTRRARHRICLREALHLPAHEPDIATAEILQPAFPGAILLAGTRPNSWCGISSEVIEIFSQTMSLCRGSTLR